jgi:hypothetical protein
MPTVNATKYAIIGSTYGGSFTTARQTGNFATNQPSGYTSGVYMSRVTGKAGTVYRISRFFMAFDLSAYSGQIITNLTLTFRSTTNSSSGGFSIKLLKHTAQGSGTTFSNATTSEFYSDVDFSSTYSTGLPYFSDANANNTQTLSSSAMTDASSGSLRVVIVQSGNDASNSAPTSTTDDLGVLSTSSTIQSGFIPYLTFTATPAGWTDGDVNGVLNADIDDVNSVDKTDIKYVNNVDAAGNLLIIRGGSMSGSPQNVYTSKNPSYSITNGDIIYEDVGLTSPFDGDDTFYWVNPTCSISATAYADIDNDGELSNTFCISP